MQARKFRVSETNIQYVGSKRMSSQTGTPPKNISVDQQIVVFRKKN
jgi:hypothetical protein